MSKKDRRMIKVYVCGEVENPGVYELPEGSRVEDVLFMAKVKPTADLQSINLAKRLRDEDMIRVHSSKEVSIKVNINTASERELSKLPGISPKTARKIVQYREKYGNFTNINELLRIDGITVEDLEEISKYIHF
ncbi:MAG: ComEA family DNA-binding protein [bacterium]